MKTVEEIERHIAELVGEISLGTRRPDDIRGEDRLIGNLGLDSLDYASVLLGCERWLGIKVREDGVNWGKISTVATLAAFLASQQE